MNFSADVIIAGAGPAGSIAAYYLAQKGVKVLVLEKESFPRYKSCGGGLTQKTLSILPFNISPVVEREVRNMTFTTKFKKEFTKTSDNVLITTVMRDKFDAFLLEQAVKEGAEVKHNTKVLSVMNDGLHIDVHTSLGDYKAKIMIAADGANSMIARSLCLMEKNIYKGFAVEYELQVSPESLEKFSDTIHLDWGTVPTGYAWLFPKNDHISVGVGCINSLVPCLKTYYQEFIAQKGIKIEKVISMKGHSLLSGTTGNKLGSGAVLLAGDAAGLIDPLTGEGIYYAIRSGRIAANSSYDYLTGISPDAKNYQQAVENELMPELSAAKPLLYYFNAMPSRIHNYINNGENGWRNFCQVLAGELTYEKIPDKLRKLKFLWKPAGKLAQLFFYIKRKSFRMRKINCTES